MAAADAEAEVQLTVTFTTKLPEEYRIPDNPLTVPGFSRRGALSKVINHVLHLDPTRPFDFLVEGTLLRTTLQAHFTEHQLSVERQIQIEYIPVILPPKTKKTTIHDDWISSVNGRGATLLTASYDGTVKGWTKGLDCLWSIAAHEHPITCVTHVPQSDENMFVTASQDFQVKAWVLVEEEPVPEHTATLSGHADSVYGVAASPDGLRCCSVGWGEEIYIWPCGASLIEAEGTPQESSKRQKTSVPPTQPVKTVSSLGQLHGHHGCVSDVVWPQKHTLFTCGWDHTIRRWDAQTGSTTETLTSHKVIHSITSPPDGSSVIAFGSADCILRLWDSRQKTESISLKLYRSHSNWIRCVSWSPISDFHIASGSYDHSVRVWDIRGNIPLITSASHEDKCLSVDWSEDWVVVSGGADCALHQHYINAELC